MPLVEISQEHLDFLENLSKEILNQDNCATASPYYYVVQTTQELSADPQFSTDSPRLWASNDGESPLFNTEEEVISYLKNNNPDITLHEIDLFLATEIEEVHVQYVENEHNVFLTRAGYEDHMRTNRHNYGGVTQKNPRPYIKHAYRNKEFKTLIDVVHALGAKND